MLSVCLLLFVISSVTLADTAVGPEWSLHEWTNFRPCAKQLDIHWKYTGERETKRFVIKNTFYVWSDTVKKGKWKEENIPADKSKRSLSLKNSELGSANKLSVCVERIGGRLECSRVVYVKVPKEQFGEKSQRVCRERSFPVPPDLTSVRIVDVQFPDLEEEVSQGVTIKWECQGEFEFTRGFIVKVESLKEGEWIESSKEIGLDRKQYLLQGLDYSVTHFVSVCGDEKREGTPEICSKRVDIRLGSEISQKGYIGPSLTPQRQAERVPINTMGGYTTETEVTVTWRYPFKQDDVMFEVSLFSNCEYPSALKREMRAEVRSVERVAVFSYSGRDRVCVRVCVGGTGCGVLVSVVYEVVTPPLLMAAVSMLPVSLQASKTQDTHTYLLVSAQEEQLEKGGKLLVTCWGSHIYKGRQGGRMVRKVLQVYKHTLRADNENSLLLRHLLPDMEYTCSLDGQLRDRIVISTNDAVFKTIAGRPTPPPSPQLQGSTHVTSNGIVTEEFSLYLLPSSEREGRPEFYELVAIPLIRYTDHFGRDMYKPEFPPNTIVPQYRDPLGKIPSSIHHQLIAKQVSDPVPFQVYRLDHALLPMNITFNTPLDPSLWRDGTEYSFILLAYSYSGVNGSLVYSVSQVSPPVRITNGQRASQATELQHDPSDPVRVVGQYMDRAFDMTIGRMPEEHHKLVSTAVGLLGYILAGVMGVLSLILLLLYLRLRVHSRRYRAKVTDEDTPMLPENGGVADSEGESFYYENTRVTRGLDTGSDSEGSMSSLPYSPIVTPQLTHRQEQLHFIEAVNPVMHSPTLSPASHQLSHSIHPQLLPSKP